MRSSPQMTLWSSHQVRAFFSPRSRRASPHILQSRSFYSPTRSRLAGLSYLAPPNPRESFSTPFYPRCPCPHLCPAPPPLFRPVLARALLRLWKRRRPSLRLPALGPARSHARVCLHAAPASCTCFPRVLCKLTASGSAGARCKPRSRFPAVSVPWRRRCCCCIRACDCACRTLR